MGLHETMTALSDPIRREILILLKDKKMSVGELLKNFDMTGATLSYHLNKLKKAKLIFETKDKNFIFYQLNTSVFEEIMLWFSQFGGTNNEEKN